MEDHRKPRKASQPAPSKSLFSEKYICVDTTSNMQAGEASAKTYDSGIIDYNLSESTARRLRA
jgi:hypothetical protein